MARPSTPLISRTGAAEAALAVIDEHGLSGLNLNRVAEKLGVRSPSLYFHFKDKTELLQEVARLLLLNIPGMKKTNLSFDERMITVCVLARRSLLRHPNAAQLMLQFFPRHLLLEAYDEAIAANPHPPEFHLTIIEGTEKLTFGSALFAAATVARGVPPMPAVNEAVFPSLAQAIRHNQFDDEEALFVENLRMFLAGARLRIQQGTAGQPVGGDDIGF